MAGNTTHYYAKDCKIKKIEIITSHIITEEYQNTKVLIFRNIQNFMDLIMCLKN